MRLNTTTEITMIEKGFSGRTIQKSRICIFAVCFLVLSVQAMGQTEYPFEKARPLYIGARALGMGNAVTAIADDATAGFWNPAGLIQWQGVRLFGMMKFHDRDDYRFDPKGIGFSWRGYSLFWGNKIALDVPSGISDYNYYSFVRQLGSYFATGISLKFRRQHPADYYQFFGYHTSYDVGLLFKPHPRLKFGCLLQNLENRGIQWITVGSAYSYSSYQFSADISFLTEGASPEFYFGAEWSPTSFFFMRIGNSNGAFTGGVGLRIIDVYVHYARIFEELSASDFISAELWF